jgi:ABC-type dipeptide/oligopeptide/nickel transport system permease subunit
MSLTTTTSELATSGGDVDVARPHNSRGKKRFSWLRSWKTLSGVIIVGFFVLMAIVGPYIVRADPSAMSLNMLQGPSSAHWLGTTQSGQDVLAQLVDGSRSTLIVAFLAASIATVVSIAVGLAGGYLGGISDELLSVLSNIFLVIPTLPLVIVLAGYLPNKGDISVTLVIALTGWAWGARVMRAQTLSIRKRDYIEAARAVGEGTTRILFWEILPNELAIVTASFLFTAVFAILTAAGLAFLGLANVSEWSWGTMLYWAQNDSALQAGAWWWFVPPGLCIALVGAGLSLLNFGFDEMTNPRLRSAGKPVKKSKRDKALVVPVPVRPDRAALTDGSGFTPVRRTSSPEEA